MSATLRHSPEPWKFTMEDGSTWLRDRDGAMIAWDGFNWEASCPSSLDLARIEKCVNGCEAIPDPDGLGMVIEALVDICRNNDRDSWTYRTAANALIGIGKGDLVP